MTNSRRLKHYHTTIFFDINSTCQSDLESILYRAVDGNIRLTQKYINKGSTLSMDIKRVIPTINIVTTDNGITVQLKIHIQHYAKVYFDETNYLAIVTHLLGFQPGSVKLRNDQSLPVPKKQIQRNNKMIDMNEDKTLKTKPKGSFIMI